MFSYFEIYKPRNRILYACTFIMIMITDIDATNLYQ